MLRVYQCVTFLHRFFTQISTGPFNSPSFSLVPSLSLPYFRNKPLLRQFPGPLSPFCPISEKAPKSRVSLPRQAPRWASSFSISICKTFNLSVSSLSPVMSSFILNLHLLQLMSYNRLLLLLLPSPPPPPALLRPSFYLRLLCCAGFFFLDGCSSIEFLF